MKRSFPFLLRGGRSILNEGAVVVTYKHIACDLLSMRV